MHLSKEVIIHNPIEFVVFAIIVMTLCGNYRIIIKLNYHGYFEVCDLCNHDLVVPFIFLERF